MKRGHMEAIHIHKIRLNSDRKCGVCGAEPLQSCTFGADDEGPPIDAELGWLEFQVLVAVNNLKDYDPNHYLVRVLSAALTPNYEGEGQPCSLLRNQAE